MTSAAAAVVADLPLKTPTASPSASASASASADPTRVRIFLDILSRAAVLDVEAALSSSGVSPSPADVESVLKLSYSNPASAIKFFRWSGLKIKHSHFSWNLMVDILGKNSLFEPMWDAIRSMKQDSALSVATFASVFGSYCSAGKVKEAIMTFDVMDRYGLPQDSVAVNSLLSAICRLDGHTKDAADVFDRVKTRIPPDADTFAILLEGWEKEGNFQRAKTTFGEMVIRVGWNQDNMSAYDAFLTTLVRAGQPDEAINFLKVMKSKNCLPGIKFFANALDILVKKNDARQADVLVKNNDVRHAIALWDDARHVIALWDLMVTDSGLVPNLVMYNAVIALVCNNRDFNSAFRFLDAMPFHGVFPDSLTYNTIFECLVRNRKAKEADMFFAEMRKNEQLPSSTNCVGAIRMFFDDFDPLAALDVWNYAVKVQVRPDDDCANELLLGLASLGRLSEVRTYADEMLDRGVHLRSATMDKLKMAFAKARKEDTYDRIARRVKRRLE